MIKSKYLMSQEISCKMPGHFTIHELAEGEVKDGDQISQVSELHVAPQQYVGQFSESGLSWICCCSFKPISSLQLQMYGQRLSHATCQSSCCLNVCSGQLLVSTVNKVLLGIIKKGCGCCSGPFMVVEDEAGKDIFHIKVDCCQWANICPRLLKCKSEVVYTITNGEGKQVGRVTNIYRTCFSSICCLRDDFEVVLDGVQKQKDKILLLNAVVFINQLKHQLF